MDRGLGVPFASFNAPAGHRSCAPEDYRRSFATLRRGRRRFHAPFRRVLVSTFWRLGFRQSKLSRCRPRVPRHATPGAWARLPVSWHAAVPFTSRIRVSHQTHRHLLQSMPAARAIQAVRLVAHRRYEASGGDRRVDLLRGRGRAEPAPAEGPDLGTPRPDPGGHRVRQGLGPGLGGWPCVLLRPGARSHLFYRVRIHRGRRGERRSMSEADYAGLITAAHQELQAPVILIWDNLNTP